MSVSQLSDSVFEALFRQAIIDNIYEEVDSYPPDEELTKMYTFSDAHEKRMKALFARVVRQARFHAVAKWSWRSVAAIMIVATILFGALMFVPQVRAAVVQTLTEWYEKFVRFTSDAPETEKTNLEPTHIPQGFVEVSREDIPMMLTVIYVNDDSSTTIAFQSFRAADSASVDNEDMNYLLLEIEGVKYHFLISNDGSGKNSIVWDADGQRYTITSTISTDELLKMAISVKK
jgi:hypothetical protein